ncbi:DNA gyrase inhibitor YacG [Nitrosomonas sp.]|uniref:DNA gyrase inhibitor YacG n=1 Tax=Nitrosomonas sp. TaxID=42353 RepID=UPI001DE3270F|nr:DNA gyrase inhibitor YacG [Nitrosomonas sp.]MCB1948079.1 DNA gyrase inhibitor YacG [Nitrosomonas sp.]MCP5244079.1 DNA gyrase inhibitor YacG [Burkholderiales bacterium]MDR4513687.1 DNA gyrase inhibitor YacG [Nitrosomonas sp.]
MKQRTVNCPQCGKSVIWNQANRFRPFCSERCKTMDLAHWAQESYRFPEPELPDTEHEENVKDRN